MNLELVLLIEAADNDFYLQMAPFSAFPFINSA